MRKIYFLLFIILSNLLFGQQEITIKTKEKIEYPINKIEIIIELKSSDMDKMKALEENHQKCLEIIELLNKYGYKKNEIETRNQRIMPRRNRRSKNNNSKIYNAYSGYSFILDKLEFFDTIKFDLMENGVETIHYKKITDNVNEYKKKAYEKAINKARKNAEIMIQSFDDREVRLKKIIDGGVSYSRARHILEDEMLGHSKESSPQLAYIPNPSAPVKINKDQTITKLTGTVMVDLLLVFEVIEK